MRMIQNRPSIEAAKVRGVLLVILLASCPSAAFAEIKPGEEALVRCNEDFQLAYEVTVPPAAEGQTDLEVLNSLDFETAEVARGMVKLAASAVTRRRGWTHNTAADSARVDMTVPAARSGAGLQTHSCGYLRTNARWQ